MENTDTGSAESAKSYLAKQLLGPTFEYLGFTLRDATAVCVENIKNVLEKAAALLGEEINRPGDVPPRVLRGIMNEAAYCQDEICAEYLGGVLASSRSDGNRDDRGVVISSMIARLSVYQIRTHYICYHMLKDLYDGTDSSITYSHVAVQIPLLKYAVLMGFHENEFERATYPVLSPIVDHTLFGLLKEDLITSFRYHADGLRLEASPLGIELFLWGHGHGMKDLNDFFDPNTICPISESLYPVGGAVSAGKGGQLLLGGFPQHDYIYEHTVSCPLVRKPPIRPMGASNRRS